jgi:hypothetical protein
METRERKEEKGEGKGNEERRKDRYSTQKKTNRDEKSTPENYHGRPKSGRDYVVLYKINKTII